MAELVQYYGTGRRKTAIARVYLRPGSGDFKVNGRAFEEYFVTPAQRSAAKAPLASTDTAVSFNVIANVLGGGVRAEGREKALPVQQAVVFCRDVACNVCDAWKERRSKLRLYGGFKVFNSSRTSRCGAGMAI